MLISKTCNYPPTKSPNTQHLSPITPINPNRRPSIRPRSLQLRTRKILQVSILNLPRIQLRICKTSPHTRDIQRICSNAKLQTPMHICSQLQLRSHSTRTSTFRTSYCGHREFRVSVRDGLELDERGKNNMCIWFSNSRLMNPFYADGSQDSDRDILRDNCLSVSH